MGDERRSVAVRTMLLFRRFVETMLTDFRQFFETLLLAVAALLPIVNPLGGAPIYLAKTADLSRDAHGELSRRIAVNCFTLLLVSTFIGAYVLDFFGLSIPAVQSARGAGGGANGWGLLKGPGQGPGALADGVWAVPPPAPPRRPPSSLRKTRCGGTRRR